MGFFCAIKSTAYIAHFSCATIYSISRSVDLNFILKHILFLTCFLYLTIACSKKEEKITELKYLPLSIQTIIADAQMNCPICGVTLLKYSYNEQVIYGSVCNGPACNCFMVFYDQNGEQIEYNAAKYQDINSKKSLSKELFRCEG